VSGRSAETREEEEDNDGSKDNILTKGLDFIENTTTKLLTKLKIYK